MEIEIKHKWNGEILFSGEFTDIKTALVNAVNSGANLRGADLSDIDLSGADISDAYLRGANFRGANLRGANLSDTDIFGANFWGANLSCANLSCANLKDAGLRDANLKGANLSGADLRGAKLSGAYLSNAKIRDKIVIKQAPIQVQGLAWPVTIWDKHMQIGCEFHPHEDWRGFDDKKWLNMGGKAALTLKKEHLKVLMAFCSSHNSKIKGASGSDETNE